MKYNHQHVVSYLLGQGCVDYRGETFNTAIRFASIAVIQMMLLKTEATPERKKNRAQDGLRATAFHGRDDAIPLLLTYDIDINYLYGSWNKSGQITETALQVARSAGNHAFAQLLLDNGALDSEPEQSQTAQIGRVDAVGPPTEDHPMVNQMSPCIWPKNRFSKSLS